VQDFEILNVINIRNFHVLHEFSICFSIKCKLEGKI